MVREVRTGIERAEHERLMAEAVARAVAAAVTEERGRWQAVQAAVHEVQEARHTDDAFQAERAQREAQRHELTLTPTPTLTLTLTLTLTRPCRRMARMAGASS